MAEIEEDLVADVDPYMVLDELGEEATELGEEAEEASSESTNQQILERAAQALVEARVSDSEAAFEQLTSSLAAAEAIGFRQEDVEAVAAMRQQRKEEGLRSLEIALAVEDEAVLSAALDNADVLGLRRSQQALEIEKKLNEIKAQKETEERRQDAQRELQVALEGEDVSALEKAIAEAMLRGVELEAVATARKHKAFLEERRKKLEASQVMARRLQQAMRGNSSAALAQALKAAERTGLDNAILAEARAQHSKLLATQSPGGTNASSENSASSKTSRQVAKPVRRKGATAAAAALGEATIGSDLSVLASSIAWAEKAGHTGQDLEAAKKRHQGLVQVEKDRRETVQMRDALEAAVRGTDVEYLRSVVDKAEAFGLEELALSAARRRVAELELQARQLRAREAARCELRALLETGAFEELEEALAKALQVGLEAQDLVESARARLAELRRAKLREKLTAELKAATTTPSGDLQSQANKLVELVRRGEANAPLEGLAEAQSKLAEIQEELRRNFEETHAHEREESATELEWAILGEDLAKLRMAWHKASKLKVDGSLLELGRLRQRNLSSLAVEKAIAGDNLSALREAMQFAIICHIDPEIMSRARTRRQELEARDRQVLVRSAATEALEFAVTGGARDVASLGLALNQAKQMGASGDLVYRAEARMDELTEEVEMEAKKQAEKARSKHIGEVASRVLSNASGSTCSAASLGALRRAREWAEASGAEGEQLTRAKRLEEAMEAKAAGSSCPAPESETESMQSPEDPSRNCKVQKPEAQTLLAFEVGEEAVSQVADEAAFGNSEKEQTPDAADVQLPDTKDEVVEVEDETEVDESARVSASLEAAMKGEDRNLLSEAIAWADTLQPGPGEILEAAKKHLEQLERQHRNTAREDAQAALQQAMAGDDSVVLQSALEHAKRSGVNMKLILEARRKLSAPAPSSAVPSEQTKLHWEKKLADAQSNGNVASLQICICRAESYGVSEQSLEQARLVLDALREARATDRAVKASASSQPPPKKRRTAG
mmetsp:Transcript_89658/g.159243  ORF Transcript_89658/g.159243 Transcript_89658/m.159243 type:complete len:1020 (+) Transcript_89658:172-3231(+)